MIFFFFLWWFSLVLVVWDKNLIRKDLDVLLEVVLLLIVGVLIGVVKLVVKEEINLVLWLWLFVVGFFNKENVWLKFFVFILCWFFIWWG